MNVAMLNFQDESQSKKGLGELYAVSISYLLNIM